MQINDVVTYDGRRWIITNIIYSYPDRKVLVLAPDADGEEIVLADPSEVMPTSKNPTK